MAVSKGAAVLVMVALLVAAAGPAASAAGSSAGAQAQHQGLAAAEAVKPLASRKLQQLPAVPEVGGSCALPLTDCKSKKCCEPEKYGCVWTGIRDSGVPLVAACRPLSACNAAGSGLCNIDGLGSVLPEHP